MTIQGPVARPPLARPARPLVASPSPVAPSAPGDLEGLSAAAYGGLARSFREKGRADLADQYTLQAVKAAKDGHEALKYATQRHGPQADAPAPMNQYVRKDAPYVASPDMQARAVALAAARFTSFEAAEWALRTNPAQTPAANAPMIVRLVDLAEDRDQVRDAMPLVRLLGSAEGIAYAEAAMKARPRPSFWTRLSRVLQQL